MTRRLVPGGLRAQLALAIALVTAIAVGASFLALYNITSSRLRAQIDSQLRTQAAEWRQFTAHADFRTSAALELTASQFIAAQRYHAESLIIVVQVSGGRTVSNNSELLVREEARERSLHETTGLLGSPTGLVTASVAEAGTMRVLAQPIDYGNRRVGTLRVANPLTPVQQAQASLRRAFLVVGVIALALAIAAGIGLATLIAAPLRRMARVAAAVDAGDLSMRAGPVAARGEVRLLSEAFDRMLERLDRAFRRQRDFVSDASHELRTPLSVLRAQVELLDRETDERSRHEGTATLLRRLDELDRLVGDMLTLASAEAGQLVEPRPIDLSEFFEDLRRDLPLFGERDFQLQPVDGTPPSGPRPAHTSATQPRPQRRRPHQPRRSSNRNYTSTRRPTRDLRQRQRAWHSARPTRARLRTLPPPRSQPLARSRRHRPRPRDRTRDRRSPWGTDPR